MNEIWNTLYRAAKSVLKPRKVSEMLEAGGVAATVESETGKIYVGVCVDSACTLGICAERNAIFNLLTNGENGIKRVVAVNRKGKVLPPCGACRELIAQLMPNRYKTVEVLLNYEKDEVVTLGELTPKWWI